MTPVRILGVTLMLGLIGLAFSPLGRAERRPASPSVYLTYQQPDGNRWVQGKGTAPKVRVVDIPLREQPVWLVAGPMPEGSVWVSVTQEGAVQAVYVRDTYVEALALSPSRLPSGMPPVLIIEKGRPHLLTATIPTASALTHPVRLPST